MPLASGTKLGPYEIQSPLGAGGMGEVYRARDTQLERTVAIKILPPQLSNDPLRKQRFEREAKTISNLNHPHICVLHDVQVWLHDLSQETLTRFTFEGNRNLNSVWTPDGKRIAFNSNKEGPPQSIFRQLADGSGGPERLTGGQYARVPMSWSPMAVGWPISRMSPAAMKSMCSPIRAPAASGKSRQKVARSQPGIPTGGSYATAVGTR